MLLCDGVRGCEHECGGRGEYEPGAVRNPVQLIVPSGESGHGRSMRRARGNWGRMV